MNTKFREATSFNLTPLRPHLKWVVVGFAIVISFGSILYTNHLVEQLRERESRQIDIYASSLQFLANETQNTNFILVFDEIVKANRTIPVILTDQSGKPEEYRNLKRADRIEDAEEQTEFLLEEIERMKEQHDPILIRLVDNQENEYGQKLIFTKTRSF